MDLLFDSKYNMLREMQDQGIVEFKYCPSEGMIADVLDNQLPSNFHPGFITD